MMKCRCRIGYVAWLLILTNMSVEGRAERKPDSPSNASIVVTGSVEKTLGCLGIPTSTDVRNLTDKVEQLTKKVEKLAENLQH